MAKTKPITVSVCVPISVVLDVTWDGEETEIHRVALSPGATLTPREIYEHSDDLTMTEIDRLAAAAFEEDA